MRGTKLNQTSILNVIVSRFSIFEIHTYLPYRRSGDCLPDDGDYSQSGLSSTLHVP